MAFGPGKYGANAAELLARFGGTMCVVLMNGAGGWGFDVATADPTLLQQLPTLLRDTATAIEADLQRGGPFGTPNASN
jgi:hypothetical protein